MNELGKVDIQLSVRADIAAALADHQRRLALERMIERWIGLDGRDPLEDALDVAAAEATAAGFTEADLAEELAAYNAERRS